jgi:formate dehydrogenase major subunit
MKQRLREGASLIVIDPRRIDLVRTAHVEAAFHLQLKPGTNVAVLNSLAHVIVTEGLAKEDYVRSRCDVARISFTSGDATAIGSPSERDAASPIAPPPSCRLDVRTAPTD